MNVSPKQRTEYIGIRVTPDEKAVIQKAADFMGMSITDFLVGAAMIEANNIYGLYEEMSKQMREFIRKWRGTDET